ncbi:MAG: hypothetical protein ACTHJ0_12265 [Flavipsychrobacter sp.]
MKSITKTFFAFAIAMTCLSYHSNAQLIVNIRPARPVYVRPVAPSPRHVWVDEEWRERNGHYEFAGGHWVAAPRPGAMWVPGHWVRRPRGWFWRPGHWRY